jgi:hypothetical protein
MQNVAHWHGQTLNTALQESPSLVLSFYSYGVILRKQDDDAVSEYAVDPAQIALALGNDMRFDTGIIQTDTLLVRQDGIKKTIVEYRKAQMTGIYLEGSLTPLRVPLPALILIRHTQHDARPQYHIYATKRRPKTLDAPLYHAPLPNIFHSGNICWGNVAQPSSEELATTSLATDWQQLLGTPFGDHGCVGKSKSHHSDIRQKLIALEAQGAKRYPTSDLIPAKKKLAEVLA